MTLVSFIVPVYQAEEFLPFCLESIRNQSITDIEIICINDASSDQSKTLIQACSQKDPRIISIDLEKNMGSGYARNQGLKVAKGKYIRMVDADDFIPSDSTRKLLDASVQYGSDFVRGGFWRCRSDGQQLRKGGRYPDKLLINGSFRHDRELWFFDQHWTYLYKREVIRKAGARYDEGMGNGQDVAFLLPLLPYMKKVTIIPETIYFYRRNQTSIMNSHKNKQYYLNLFQLYEMEYQQLASVGFREQVDYFIFYHLANILPGVVFPSIPGNLQDQEAVEVLSTLKEIFDKYNIRELCMSSKYAWQKERTIPLLSKQIVTLLSENYVRESYAVIEEYVKNKKHIRVQQALIEKQQKQIRSLLTSTSWRLTAPLRWLKGKNNK